QGGNTLLVAGTTETAHLNEDVFVLTLNLNTGAQPSTGRLVVDAQPGRQFAGGVAVTVGGGAVVIGDDYPSDGTNGISADVLLLVHDYFGNTLGRFTYDLAGWGDSGVGVVMHQNDDEIIFGSTSIVNGASRMALGVIRGPSNPSGPLGELV